MGSHSGILGWNKINEVEKGLGLPVGKSAAEMN